MGSVLLHGRVQTVFGRPGATQLAADLAPGLPRISRIELRGRGGVTTATDMLESNRFEWEAGGSRVKIPATWLSQGYQGTIARIADLIGQAYLEAWTPFELSEFERLAMGDATQGQVPSIPNSLANALGVSRQAVSQQLNRKSKYVRPRNEQTRRYWHDLNHIIVLLYALIEKPSDDDLRRWLHAPNRALRLQRPIDLIAKGELHPLKQVLTDAFMRAHGG